MTARTTGGRPNPGRSPGSGGTPKRPTKRPATTRSTTGGAKDNPVGLTVVGGTAVDDVEPETVAEAVETEAVEAAETVEAPEADETAVVIDLTAVEETEPADEAPDVVIDLTAVEEHDEDDVETAEQPVEETAPEAAEEPVAAAPSTSPSTDPAGVPPIDASVLLRAILTPPAGIASGEGLTDALTGAVPTWRLDEEPIYLETIRDLGVPAVPEADGGTGEVIVGEIVEQEV